MIFRNFRFAPFALAALITCGVPAESSAENRIDVKFVENLTLAGYGKKDDALKWAIDAERAELRRDSAPAGKDPLKNGVWDVRELTVQTFADGRVSVTVSSPTAVFSPVERRAESDARVSVSDAQGRFSVSGKGWFWQCDRKDDANAIAVRDEVVVKLYDAEKPAREITVTSASLHIALRDEETVLSFSGAKNRPTIVVQGETKTFCDVLEIVVPADASQIEDASAARASAKTGDGDAAEADALKRIEKISGVGNARIRSGAREVRGDAVDFTPDSNSFRVRGNVVFDDRSAALEVRGDEAVGFMREDGKKLLLEKIVVTGAPGVPVAVETASLENRRADARDRAKFTGKKLSVLLDDETETRILFEENVRVNDRTVRLRCDELDVRARREAEGRERLAAVREIRARGNVKATQDGREIDCGEARIFPGDGRTTLTGAPRVSVPAQRFALAGHRCEIFHDAKRVEVFRDEADAASRVTATLGDGGNGAAETTLSGEFLEVEPDAAAPEKFAVFALEGDVTLRSPSRELEGACARLVAFCDVEKTKAKNAAGTRGRKSAGGNGELDAVRKIEAFGNVRLRKGETEISGGKALIFNDVVVEEWNETDAAASPGGATKIVVLPEDGADGIADSRPRVELPRTRSADALTLPLPSSDAAKKRTARDAGTIVARGDALEAIADDAGRRLRFWLRGNVSLTTADGVCAGEELEAEARRADADSPFEPEALFCRRNVRVTRGDATASGDLLEIFPKKQIGFLAGNARMESPKFGVTVPGKSAGDRFVLDLAKSEVRIETDPRLLEGNPAQVATPRTLLPKGVGERFEERFGKSRKRP